MPTSASRLTAVTLLPFTLALASQALAQALPRSYEASPDSRFAACSGSRPRSVAARAGGCRRSRTGSGGSLS